MVTAMSEYTPTICELREAWLSAEFEERDCSTSDDDLRAEFDRWLAAHYAEVRAGVVTEEPEWEYGIRADGDDEPYTDHSDDPDWLCDQVTPEPGDAIVRRRKAGLWVPVKQEGAETDG